MAINQRKAHLSIFFILNNEKLIFSGFFGTCNFLARLQFQIFQNIFRSSIIKILFVVTGFQKLEHH